MAVCLSGVKTLTVYTPLMHFLSGELHRIPYRQENLSKREMERVHWKAFLLLCQKIFSVNKEALMSITRASLNCDMPIRHWKSLGENYYTNPFSAVSSVTPDEKTFLEFEKLVSKRGSVLTKVKCEHSMPYFLFISSLFHNKRLMSLTGHSCINDLMCR